MTAVWPRVDELGLLTDLYELNMAQAYHLDGKNGEARFSLFYRVLPGQAQLRGGLWPGARRPADHPSYVFPEEQECAACSRWASAMNSSIGWRIFPLQRRGAGRCRRGPWCFPPGTRCWSCAPRWPKDSCWKAC